MSPHKMKESDSPYVFTNGFKKFTEDSGYMELDHAHGPQDTCDWWKAALHGKASAYAPTHTRTRATPTPATIATTHRHTVRDTEMGA